MLGLDQSMSMDGSSATSMGKLTNLLDLNYK